MSQFNKIWLIPSVVSTIRSRDEVLTYSNIGNISLNLPIISAPMVDVSNSYTISKIYKAGGQGIVHRFCSIEEQVQEFSKVKYAFCAIGLEDEILDLSDRYLALSKAGCEKFCIDVANGASIGVKSTIEKIIKHNPLAKFIVGNVAHESTYEWCANLPNVVGVRLGIAGGNACTTKNATGILSDLPLLIQRCKRLKKNLDINAGIIADGGISGPGDFCKAIALGADCVMLGSEIAACSDSPAQYGEVFYTKMNGATYHTKIYRGSASFENQKRYKETPRYIEGTSRTLEVTGTISEMIQRYSEGLKSSMSYFNAKNIFEFKKNVNYRIE